MGVGSGLYVCHIWVEQSDPDYPGTCYLLLSDVAILDGSAPSGSLSTDGNGAEVLLGSAPIMGVSFSFCCMLELIGSK